MENEPRKIPALTLHHHDEGKPYAWAVTLGDYYPEDPYGCVTSATFDSNEEAEAFIAECKSRPPEPERHDDPADFDDPPWGAAS